MATAKTKKMDLSGTHIFAGVHYGPGKDVEVPEGFREDAENRATARRAKFGGKSPVSPPGASGSGVAATGDVVSASGRLTPGGGTAGVAAAELEGKSKDELLAMAEAKGITVTGTGADGNILKSDLVAALSE